MLKLLLTTLLLSTSYAQQCEDVAGWTDASGTGCGWYDGMADDDYYAGQSVCATFGSCCPDANGLTAVKACCVCGGGSTFSAATCTSDYSWRDADGVGCAWYEEPVGTDDYWYDDSSTRCWIYGNDAPGTGGLVANEACCECGGGERTTAAQPITVTPAPQSITVTPAPTPSPTSSPTPSPTKRPTAGPTKESSGTSEGTEGTNNKKGKKKKGGGGGGGGNKEGKSKKGDKEGKGGGKGKKRI